MKISRSQAAQMLHVTPKTLYSWERAGKIPPPERDWRGWRWYDDTHLEAIRRHMAGASEAAIPATPPTAVAAASRDAAADAVFTVSARNRLAGTVVSIVGDGVLSEVTLRLSGGQEIVAVITRSSVERLGLTVGGTAVALIKSTEVLLAR